MTMDRQVSFRGLTNFRDLGGYVTHSAGLTRWGQVFRSDSLHSLTPDDLATFDALGIRTIFDLRRDEERVDAPGPRPCTPLTVPSRRVLEADPHALTSREAGERWLFEDYCGMLAHAGPMFGHLFSRLAKDESRPAVFHCWGGKDRTGVASALLLSLLGVDREIVLDDYELTTTLGSADNLQIATDLFVGIGISRGAAEGMLSTPRWALAEALAVLDATYGGIESYLLGPGEMDRTIIAGLRDRLVT